MWRMIRRLLERLAALFGGTVPDQGGGR